MSLDEGYGPLQMPISGYAAFQQGNAPAGSGGGQGGGSPSMAAPSKPAKTKPKKPPPKPFKVTIRVDDMAGSLAANATILTNVAGLFKAAQIDVDIAYGKFMQRELEFDGVIPVLIVSEPMTADEQERWIANQDAMNLELFAQPSKLADELPPGSATGTSLRETIGLARMMLAGKDAVPINLLHAPVAISAGRLRKFVNQLVPAQFAGQVFITEMSCTIAHECGHTFGLAGKAKDGSDTHPSDPRNVMSRSTLDSLGGADKLPKKESEWSSLLKGYKLPIFVEADSKVMQDLVTKKSKEKPSKRKWGFPPKKKKKQDRIPDAKHFEPEPQKTP